uniref:Uncharacterized protein n=1 Tax=Percolomonas cosmopolitus TaxID=63605 RepID=A0A7S1KUM4_9EUKA|eukprot:CAMPEP_0117441724 /NCGR_PEP_ID=MMETSP0759-20121206/3780_1 /TAXON_ID=63605 /ORGANISM="Percolomonas cosmopolitus, Strain WS" /LENGTH=572 /DNA_ID=CAMNT_0005233583 /DNA_START=26 /DNA_END=1744 /DNA_ORIENTATION=-
MTDALAGKLSLIIQYLSNCEQYEVQHKSQQSNKSQQQHHNITPSATASSTTSIGQSSTDVSPSVLQNSSRASNHLTYPLILKRFHRLEDIFRKITYSSVYSWVHDFPSDYYEVDKQLQNRNTHHASSGGSSTSTRDITQPQQRRDKLKVIFPHPNSHNLAQSAQFLKIPHEYKYQMPTKRFHFEKKNRFLREKLEQTYVELQKGLRSGPNGAPHAILESTARRPNLKKLKQMRDFMEEGTNTTAKGPAAAASTEHVLPPPPKTNQTTNFVAYKYATVDSLKKANPVIHQQHSLQMASKNQSHQRKKSLVQSIGIAPSNDPSTVLQKKKKMYRDLADSMTRSQKYSEELQKKSSVAQSQHHGVANSTPHPQGSTVPAGSSSAQASSGHLGASTSKSPSNSLLSNGAKLGTLPPNTLAASHINRNISPYNAMLGNVHLAGMVQKGPGGNNNFSLQPPPPPGTNMNLLGAQQGPGQPGQLSGMKRKASNQLNSNSSLKKRRTGSVQSLSINTKNPGTLGGAFPANLRIEPNSARLLSGGINSPGITPDSLKNLPKMVQQNILQMRGIKQQEHGNK